MRKQISLEQENFRQTAKFFRWWCDWHVGEIKKVSESLDRTELGLKLLDHDPQRDINRVLRSSRHTRTLNSKFHERILTFTIRNAL